MKKNLWVLFCATIGFAYGQPRGVDNSVITIDVCGIKPENATQIKLSDIADSVSYILLSKNVLIGNVGLIRPIDDKHFVIYSDKMVYRYTNEGKFVNKLFNNGRAANEAVCLSVPIVNRDRGFVLVRDNVSSYYKMFSGDGKLLNKREKTRGNINLLPTAFAGNLEIIWLMRSDFHNNKEKCNPFAESIFEVRNTNSGEVVYKYPNPYAKYSYKMTDQSLVDSGNDVCVGKVKNSYWFKIKDMDTVFTTTNFKDVKAKYIIKAPEPKLDFIESMKSRFGAADRSMSNYFRNSFVLLTNRYLFLSFANNTTLHKYLYDTKTNKTVPFKGKIINDIDTIYDLGGIWEGDQYSPIKTYYSDNKLYVPIDAIKLIDAGKAKKFPGLTENSNPVIMVVHLKEK